MSLLSKDTINKIKAEDKERSEKFGDKRPNITPGEHILILSDVAIENTKKDNFPMLVLSLSKNEETRLLKENYMIGGGDSDNSKKAVEIGLQKIVLFLVNAFGYEIQECETQMDIFNQVNKFKGKTFKAAVKIEEKLYTFTPEGKEPEMVIQKFPKLWYTGKIDDTGFKVNLDKTVVELSTEDKYKYIQFTKAKIASEPKQPTAQQAEEQGLPF